MLRLLFRSDCLVIDIFIRHSQLRKTLKTEFKGYYGVLVLDVSTELKCLQHL